MATLLPPTVLSVWPAPNYLDPVKHGPALLVVNALFFSLMTVVLILRLFSKVFIKKSFGVDDVLICFSWIFTFGTHATTTIGTQKYGWDRHSWDVPFNWFEPGIKVTYAGELLYLLAAFCASCSMLAFYFRLNRTANIPWFTWLLWIAVAINCLGWVPIFFLHIFPCRPVKAFWTFPPMYESPCVSFKIVTFGGGVFKLIFSDIMITTLPIPLILRLKMSSAQRYGVSIVLALGYVVCGAGAVRTYYLYIIGWRTTDIIWNEYPAFLASAIENDLGIICACLPFLRPMFGKYIESAVRSVRSVMRSTGSGSKAKTLQGSSATSGQRQDSDGKNKYSSTSQTELSTFIFDHEEDVENFDSSTEINHFHWRQNEPAHYR